MPKLLANTAFEPVLEAFKSYLDSLSDNQVSAGGLIQFGWSWFQLKELDGELFATAPEFGVMPMNFINDCSDSLNIVQTQRYICDSFNQDMAHCNARESAIVPFDIENCSEIIINRIEDSDGSSSGWYIGAEDSKADMNNPDNFELKSLWEISCIHPRITDFLLLPLNWQVVFDGKKTVVLHDFNEVPCVSDSYYEQKYKC